MWITLSNDADVTQVRNTLQAMGLWTIRLRGRAGDGLRVEDHSPSVPVEAILAVPGVADVAVEASAHPRVDAQAGARIEIGGRPLGHDAPVLMAGPCSIETEARTHAAAAMVAACGATFLRGGAFKPRTSPYAFQGVGAEGLRWMREAADAHGLSVVTEVMSEQEVELVGRYADLFQIGSRNMQNFALLRAVGQAGKPVLLKRAMHARVDEWLLAGEHLLAAGGGPVIFCERGVRGFETAARNLLDLTAVALLKHVHGQRVIVDPSHAAGRRDLIPALCRAALAAGADGLIVEAHPEPSQALSDGPQALHAPELEAIAREMGVAPQALG